ncbi:hypothetical protein [Streptomyces inhibens]|uniref:hypothetical protein n=1 Tax=Streptomyces inhibens TaxID=2293571 RepID=UPI00402AEC8B
MFRSTLRVVAVAGLVLVPVAGPVSGASAYGGMAAAAGGNPSGGPRLMYFGNQGRVENGEPVWFSIEGLRAGWDTVTVRSPALVEPIRLTPAKKGSAQSAQVDAPGSHHRIRGDIAPGMYPVTATAHGRTVATTRLKVTARGSAMIGRFVIGPKDAFPGSDTPADVRPGGEVLVVLTDRQPASGEDVLTVTSPVFDGRVAIRRDSADDPGCKCDDGATVYAGRATVRGDVLAGTHPLTVISHHGRQTTTRQVTVAGEPVGQGRPWLVGGIAAGVLALAAGGWVLLRRRDRKGAGFA